jgi:hypothetical protein
MANEATQQMFGISPVSLRWGVSSDTIRRQIKNGNLKALYIAGRLMIPRSEIERVEQVGLGSGRKRRQARHS